MGLWERLFGKRGKKETDPLWDLTLSSLKVGYLVDYDLKTWEVKGYHTYDFSGEVVEEWELDCGDDRIYLEREKDDEVRWTVTRKVPFSELGPGIREHIQRHEDPPEEITFQGTRFFLEESGAGYYHPEGRVAGEEMIYWDYTDSSGEKVLTIEQWGEDAFEAAVGQRVQEYEFTNILPREKNPNRF